MPEFLQENLVLVIAAIVLALVVIWWLSHASRKTKVEVADRSEGETGARRNQALIDAPPAAAGSATASLDSQEAAEHAAMEDVAPGELSAAANMQDTATAGATADAEAGAPGSAREAMQEMKDAPPPPAPASDGDDLKRIKGLGPKIVTILHGEGVTSFAQIADWSDEDIDRMDARLGRFQGRIRRDDWVTQARYLRDDDIAGYEAQFGKV